MEATCEVTFVSGGHSAVEGKQATEYELDVHYLATYI